MDLPVFQHLTPSPLLVPRLLEQYGGPLRDAGDLIVGDHAGQRLVLDREFVQAEHSLPGHVQDEPVGHARPGSVEEQSFQRGDRVAGVAYVVGKRYGTPGPCRIPGELPQDHGRPQVADQGVERAVPLCVFERLTADDRIELGAHTQGQSRVRDR
ncbi:hypothetical protein [Streptomyces sp. NPDC005407]|uniref:hypothetical protein n=1 Tax=Streptomyces sp. NPDC005407 TaxID=3155340 RepID=UPI0033BA9292